MDRLVSGSIRDVLERAQPAITDGQVNILSIKAIRDASGERWPRKREQVQTFVERTFARVSQAGDLMVCLNDTEFITVQPSVSRAMALGVSANVLKETLTFFLGKAAREDLELFLVTGFANGAFALEPAPGAILDQVLVGESGSRSEVLADRVFATQAAGRPPSDDLQWVPLRRVKLVSPPDLDLELEISPEPTWNIAAKVVASFLLRPTLHLVSRQTSPRPVCVTELTPNMAAEAALATLDYAKDLIGQRHVAVALHAPIALSALGFSASRFRLLNALRALDPGVRKLLILEIVGVSEGLPEGRLTESVSMLSAHCRAVLARAPSETTDVTAWRHCGLSGASLDCGHLDPVDRGVLSRLGAFARSASEAKLSCVGYDLPSQALIMAAWASGFTHLSGPLLSAQVGYPEAIRRLTPVDLFSNAASA